VGEFAGFAATPGVQVLTGDFNGDGRTGIALTGVAGWTSIRVALSNGDGTFQVLNVTDQQVAEFAGFAALPGVTARTAISLPQKTAPPPPPPTTVPDVRNMQYVSSGGAVDAVTVLNKAHLVAVPMREPRDPLANLVDSQNPQPGSVGHFGDTVECFLRSGQPT
jgi:hypothetical protein